MKIQGVTELEGSVSPVYNWLIPVLVFVASALLYMLNIERFPHNDELYHILAARSLAETGVPSIAEGVYERVFAYTWFVSKLFGAFGESIAVARMPSVLLMAAVVAILFCWLRVVAGLYPAIIGALLFAVSPFAVDTALFVRFYAVQTFCFFAGALLVYSALELNQKRRYPYLIVACILILCAVYFQITTLIGLAAVFTWVVLRYLGIWLRMPQPARSKHTKLLAMIAAVGLAVLAMAVWSGLLLKVWNLYSSAPLFAQSKANKFWIYHAAYLWFYPTVWPAVGFIGLAACVYKPKPAFFVGVCFVVCLLINSFAAAKGLRYIVFAQPFFFALIGIGLTPLIKALFKWIKDLILNIAELLPLDSRLGKSIGLTGIVLSTVLLVFGNPALMHSAGILGNFNLPRGGPKIDWVAAREDIDPWMNKADVVVTMADVETLYHYGHFDLMFSKSRLAENPGAKDFDPDYRTGRAIVASSEAIQSVLQCYPRGIFITNTHRWRHPDFISESVADLVVKHTESLTLPRRSGVLAFTWEHDPDPQANCEQIMQLQLSKKATATG